MAAQDHTPSKPSAPDSRVSAKDAARSDGRTARTTGKNTSAQSPRKQKRRRVLGGIVGTPILLLLVVLLVVQTNWGARTVGRTIIALANPFEGVTIDVARIDGNWITRLELYDIHITRDDTVHMARLDTLRLRYRLPALLRKTLHIRDLYAAGLTVVMQQHADSTWDVLNALGPEAPPDTTAGTFTVRMDRFRLDRGGFSARFYAPDRDSTVRFQQVTTRLTNLVLGPSPALRLDALRANLILPGSPDAFAVQTQALLADGRVTLDTLRLDSPGSQVTAHGTLQLPTDARDEVHDI
ncbi:MAG: hypothetical protein ACE5G0_16625, partial [Rhodothermales bacterium]